MRIITPDCRDRMTAQDLLFLQEVFGYGQLLKLLADPECRDLLLDHDELFHAILESPLPLQISLHLYCYVLVRHALLNAGIDDRVISDYVAELIAEFQNEDAEPLYAIDLAAQMDQASDREQWALMVQTGNALLVMTGIFPESLRRRQERRGAPSLAFYEDLGRRGFATAAGHRLARAHQVAGIYRFLGSEFRHARLALNDMAERLMFVGAN